jgi:hypothetical protein
MLVLCDANGKVLAQSNSPDSGGGSGFEAVLEKAREYKSNSNTPE